MQGAGIGPVADAGRRDRLRSKALAVLMEQTPSRLDSFRKALAAVEAALEKKACDLVVLQVEHLSSIADYFLVATGRSDLQGQSIPRGIARRMPREEDRPLPLKG